MAGSGFYTRNSLALLLAMSVSSLFSAQALDQQGADSRHLNRAHQARAHANVSDFGGPIPSAVAITSDEAVAWYQPVQEPGQPKWQPNDSFSHDSYPASPSVATRKPLRWKRVTIVD